MPADGGQWNVIDVLTQDHREMEDMFVRVVGLSAAGDRQRRHVIGKIITELVRHSITEERHLYPAIRAHVPRGDEVADAKLADHGATERIINELTGLDPSDMVFDRCFGRLVAAVTAQFQDEEATVFPMLTAACDADTLREIGLRAQVTKRTLPVLPSFRP
jgi:hypothetical protein